MTIELAYIELARKHLQDRVQRIKHCVNQLSDEEIWWRPHAAMNSIGNILLHLCGNMRQWIVSGVSGVPDTRNRPSEFAEQGPLPKAELLSRLDAVVSDGEAALAAFDAARLLQTRRIQGFDETYLSAIWGSLEHLSGHTQEITYITRLQLGDLYKFAWVPATAEQGAPAQS